MDIHILSCANTRCGIGRYTNELGKQIDHSDNKVHVLRKDSPKPPLFEIYKHRSFRNLRHYVAPYYLSKAVKKKESDIWLADYVDAASSFMYNRSYKGLLFTNVHDAIPFIFPTSKVAFEFYKFQLRYAASHSRKLIVVSEISKKDVSHFAGIDEEKIEVIYNGIDHTNFYPDKTTSNKQFLIRYVGGLSGQHKNVETLLSVAAVLEQKGYNFRMEIGGGHPENTKLPQLVKDLNIKSVHFTGFVPDADLRCFLSDADLFVYPSKYEGFGFPPLEAMACGTATVSSNAGSLGEVLGNGAITTVAEVDSFVDAIERVMVNPNLKKELEERAVKQASKYTWGKSADQHLTLFERERNNLKA